MVLITNIYDMGNNRDKVEALYELYKFKAKEMSLDYYNNIKFINVFIVEFVKYEEYEAAAYFKKVKNRYV